MQCLVGPRRDPIRGTPVSSIIAVLRTNCTRRGHDFQAVKARSEPETGSLRPHVSQNSMLSLCYIVATITLANVQNIQNLYTLSPRRSKGNEKMSKSLGNFVRTLRERLFMGMFA